MDNCEEKNEKKTLVYCATYIIAVFLMTFIFIKKQQINSFEDY